MLKKHCTAFIHTNVNLDGFILVQLNMYLCTLINCIYAYKYMLYIQIVKMKCLRQRVVWCFCGFYYIVCMYNKHVMYIKVMKIEYLMQRVVFIPILGRRTSTFLVLFNVWVQLTYLPLAKGPDQLSRPLLVLLLYLSSESGSKNQDCLREYVIEKNIKCYYSSSPRQNNLLDIWALVAIVVLLH